ncbi:MAG: CAP domain-containing protein [Actinomycetota bacterium]|nr:CAP domain-containing protein [Actinomycetota bacterium]
MLVTRSLSAFAVALAFLLLTALPASAASNFAAPTCEDVGLEPTAQNLSRIRTATVCLLNNERTSRGLKALSRNVRLGRAARRHADDMVASRYFAHSSKDGSEFSSRIKRTGYMSSANGWMVGENLAWGTGSAGTPEAIVRAWMNSHGHRANILNGRYVEIGISVVAGNPNNGGAGGTYVTEFGSRGR